MHLHPHLTMQFQGQGHGLRIFMFYFCVKAFGTISIHYVTLSQGQRLKIFMFKDHIFSKPLAGVCSLWYDDRYWSKILCSTILNH